MYGVSKSSTNKKSPVRAITKQAPWNKSTSTSSTTSSKFETPRKSDAPRKPAPSSPSPNITSSLQKKASLLDINRKPSISTGVYKPAPPVGPPSARRSRVPDHHHQVDLRLNKTPPPPLTPPSRMSEQHHQQSTPASASTPQPEQPDTPARSPAPICKDPRTHPGSSTRGDSPVNDFFLQRSWLRGPADHSGTVVALSDRPSLCMSVSGWELAVGSSDHAVYTIDLQTCGVTRIMHGKSYGHTEWVTCVDHLPDGRIISGGMDSKLCLWEKRGVRSRDLRGHTASVSGVKAGCFNQGSVAVSSSYDRSLILWDLGGASGREVGRLAAHKAPVMEFASTQRGRLVSGCRDGTVIMWDVGTRTPVLQCKNAHKGHITAMKALEEEEGPSEVFLSGGQDGLLQVWDFRCKKPVHFVSLHRYMFPTKKKKGIAISKNTTCGCPLITTAGADRIVKVLDPRASFNIVHSLEDHRDFIYSLFEQDHSSGVVEAMDHFWCTTPSGANASTAWELQTTGL